MEATFEGQMRQLETQLSYYSRAYHKQRELLLQMHNRLRAAEQTDGTAVTRDEEKVAPSDDVVTLLQNDDGLRRRLSEALEERQSDELYGVIEEVDGSPRDGCGVPHPGHSGITPNNTSSIRNRQQNATADAEVPAHSAIPPHGDNSGYDSGLSLRNAATAAGTTAEPVSSAQLTESLAVVSSDAASRFCKSMQRLWMAYFAHLHREVNGLLQRIDDAFLTFEANPSEETLADFLELQRQVRPLLSELLGINESEGGEQERQQNHSQSGRSSNKNRTSLPCGNPLEDTAALVRHLSLCIAEATSPLLAIALHGGGSNRRKSCVAVPHCSSKATCDVLDADGMPEVITRELPMRPASAGAHRGSKSRGGAPDDDIVDGERGERQSSPSSSSDNRGSPVHFHMSGTNRRGLPAHADESPVGARKQKPQIYTSRSRSNNSSQVERALYGGKCVQGSSPSVSSSMTLRHVYSRDNHRFSSLTPTGATSGGGINKGKDASAAAMVERERNVGAPETPDPHVHLRHLRMQEEKLSFLLVNTVSQQRDHGSEAKYYAMKKRLARIRSEILRTEREVNELQRIEEERAVLRHDRALRHWQLRN